MQEYQRQCQSCGKMWHSLVAREKQIGQSEKANCCNSVAQCGNPAAQLQASGNLDRNRSELQRLRSCPDCGSANFNERIVDHQNQLR